jgi:hypothetical protein
VETYEFLPESAEIEANLQFINNKAIIIRNLIEDLEYHKPKVENFSLCLVPFFGLYAKLYDELLATMAELEIFEAELKKAKFLETGT